MTHPPHINHLGRLTRQIGEALTSKATLVGDAVEHLAREISVTDGYPATTLGDGPRGTAELTSVERAAEARYRLLSDREQLRDMVTVMQQHDVAFGELLNRIMRFRAPRSPEMPICDSSGHDGAALPWVKHSRDPRNGWSDPLCTQYAEPDGLCLACCKRKARWRAENGQGSEVAA